MILAAPINSQAASVIHQTHFTIFHVLLTNSSSHSISLSIRFFRRLLNLVFLFVFFLAMFLFLFAHLRLFHFLFLNCNFFSVFLDAYKHASIHIQYFEPITLFAVNISLSFHGISMKFTGASISRLSFFSFIFFHFTLFTSRFTIKSSRFDCLF